MQYILSLYQSHAGLSVRPPPPLLSGVLTGVR